MDLVTVKAKFRGNVGRLTVYTKDWRMNECTPYLAGQHAPSL